MRSGVDCRGIEWEENPTVLKNKDLTGQKFGKLTVLFRVQSDANGNSQWLCQCECGNFLVTRGTSLRSLHTKSCGCSSAEFVADKLTIQFKPGDKIGYWTVMYKASEYIGKGSYWHCRCRCGKEKDVDGQSLREGRSLSCGCLQREVASQSVINLTGMKFGHWTVIEKTDHYVACELMWLCVCDCGTVREVSGHALRDGKSTSCGCVKSIGELNIIQILNDANIEYMHDKGYFKDLIGIGGSLLRYDFILFNNKHTPFRLIEFDGPQHNEPCALFGVETFENLQVHDVIKNQYALSHNIPLVRIPYSKRDSMTLEDLLGDNYLIKGEI